MEPVDPGILDGYELEVEDTFPGPDLDRDLWFPHYLPQWSSREASGARYRVDGQLRLVIEADQPPWAPEVDGGIRVSSVQTGVFAGPLGSAVGQSRFAPGLVVREERLRQGGTVVARDGLACQYRHGAGVTAAAQRSHRRQSRDAASDENDTDALACCHDVAAFRSDRAT